VLPSSKNRSSPSSGTRKNSAKNVNTTYRNAFIRLRRRACIPRGRLAGAASGASSCCAAATMRRLVPSATPGWPLMARLAVATETPTALATSRMPAGLPGASLSVVMGSSAGGMRDGPPVITLHD
jgi:hypothetical protein